MPKKIKPESPLIRGLCIACGTNPQASAGGGRWKPRCKGCTARHFGMSAGGSKARKRAKIQKFKKDHCEECGFEGHPCQLDIDHKDGDHENDDPENLQTLCANCHRLKTFFSEEGMRQCRHNKAPVLTGALKCLSD